MMEMEVSSNTNKMLKRGDKSLIYNPINQQYHRHSINYNEATNGKIQIVISLSPLFQVFTTIDGEQTEVFVDKEPSQCEDNNENTEEELAIAESIASQVLYINNNNNNNSNNSNNNNNESMVIDHETPSTEESSIIIHQQEAKSKVPSKTKSKKRQHEKPPPLQSAVKDKIPTKSKGKHSKKQKMSSNLDTPGQNSNKNKQQSITSKSTSNEEFDLGRDPELNKANLFNIMKNNFAKVKPPTQQPGTSASATKDLNQKSTSRTGSFNGLNAEGNPHGNGIIRAKTKKSNKTYNGPELQSKIDKFNLQQQQIKEKEKTDWQSSYAKYYSESNQQEGETEATTASNNFKFSYEFIRNRFELVIHQNNNETQPIKELPTKAPKEAPKENVERSKNNNSNNTNTILSQADVISDLDQVTKEEGTEVLGVFVLDDINNYSEIAKKYNVIPLNATEDLSSPPPVTTHWVPDSPFSLPYLTVNCDGFGSGIQTKTLLKNDDNIKIRFQNEELQEDERPHSYLCTLVHVLRARVVMTVLTRTSTTSMSTTFASCIDRCPVSWEVHTTWGEEAHQPKFSRDIVAIGGNIIGHRPKFMYRDVLNEELPNVSAGNRIFTGLLKPNEETKAIIMYFIVNAFFEAMENQWIQLEMKVQQTVMEKKITKADEGRLCRSSLICEKCKKSYIGISSYRYHVLQCQLNTDPDDWLKIPSLARVALKFKRASIKDDEKFAQAIQSLEDNNPEICDPKDDENGEKNEPVAELETAEIPLNEIPQDVRVLMNILKSKNFVCPTCRNAYKSFRSLQNHLEQGTCAKLALLRDYEICVDEDCYKLFKNYSGRMKHHARFHKEALLTPEEKEEVLQMYKDKEYICYECGSRPFKTYKSLAQHSSSGSHFKVYKYLKNWKICEICCEGFDSPQKLKTHNRNVHPQASTVEVKAAENEPPEDTNENMTTEDSHVSLE